MTSFDTIEFSTKTDFIDCMNKSNFRHIEIKNPNGLIIHNWTLQNKRIGTDKVSINETFGTVKIKASSKLLGANYKKGICFDTLDQFIDEIEHQGLKLKKNFVNEAELKRVDIKSDLSLNNNIDEYLNVLNHLIAPKYTKTRYDSSIVFNEEIKTTPIRFLGYNKQYEISSNPKFYKEYPELKNSFNNILRIESRYSKPGTIKKHFKSNILTDVLEQINVNYNLLTKIIGNQTKFNLLTNIQEMTNSEEKNYAHIYYLNSYYNGDYNSIIRHIKSRLGDNTKASYQREKVKKYLAMINNKEIKMDKLNELLNKLLDAKNHNLS